MYGLSAKDKKALFERRASGEDLSAKKGAPAAKKVGKLNLGGARKGSLKESGSPEKKAKVEGKETSPPKKKTASPPKNKAGKPPESPEKKESKTTVKEEKTTDGVKKEEKVVEKSEKTEDGVKTSKTTEKVTTVEEKKDPSKSTTKVEKTSESIETKSESPGSGATKKITKTTKSETKTIQSSTAETTSKPNAKQSGTAQDKSLAKQETKETIAESSTKEKNTQKATETNKTESKSKISETTKGTSDSDKAKSNKSKEKTEVIESKGDSNKPSADTIGKTSEKKEELGKEKKVSKVDTKSQKVTETEDAAEPMDVDVEKGKAIKKIEKTGAVKVLPVDPSTLKKPDLDLKSPVSDLDISMELEGHADFDLSLDAELEAAQREMSSATVEGATEGGLIFQATVDTDETVEEETPTEPVFQIQTSVETEESKDEGETGEFVMESDGYSGQPRLSISFAVDTSESVDEKQDEEESFGFTIQASVDTDETVAELETTPEATISVETDEPEAEEVSMDVEVKAEEEKAPVKMEEPQVKAVEEVKVEEKPKPEKVKPENVKAEAKQEEIPQEDKEVSEILKGKSPEKETVPAPTPPKEPESQVIMTKTFTESILPDQEFQPIADDFYNSLFYFSGMGNLIGTAMAQGVYVPPEASKRADLAVVEEAECKRMDILRQGREIVKTARSQATDLASELRRLQMSLGSLPTFTDSQNIYHPHYKGVDHRILAYTQLQQQQKQQGAPQRQHTHIIRHTAIPPQGAPPAGVAYPWATDRGSKVTTVIQSTLPDQQEPEVPPSQARFFWQAVTGEKPITQEEQLRLLHSMQQPGQTSQTTVTRTWSSSTDQTQLNGFQPGQVGLLSTQFDTAFTGSSGASHDGSWSLEQIYPGQTISTQRTIISSSSEQQHEPSLEHREGGDTSGVTAEDVSIGQKEPADGATSQEAELSLTIESQPKDSQDISGQIQVQETAQHKQDEVMISAEIETQEDTTDTGAADSLPTVEAEMSTESVEMGVTLEVADTEGQQRDAAVEEAITADITEPEESLPVLPSDGSTEGQDAGASEGLTLQATVTTDSSTAESAVPSGESAPGDIDACSQQWPPPIPEGEQASSSTKAFDWQDKLKGVQTVPKYTSPQPWQQSHIRSLEAKGIYFDRPQKGGVDENQNTTASHTYSTVYEKGQPWVQRTTRQYEISTERPQAIEVEDDIYRQPSKHEVRMSPWQESRARALEARGIILERQTHYGVLPGQPAPHLMKKTTQQFRSVQSPGTWQYVPQESSQYSVQQKTFTPSAGYSVKQQTYSPSTGYSVKQQTFGPTNVYSVKQQQTYSPSSRYTVKQETYSPVTGYSVKQQTFTPSSGYSAQQHAFTQPVSFNVQRKAQAAVPYCDL